MSLVTPKAGVSAGRSADIRVADTGGAAADAVAQFGQRIAQVGARLEADRLDREASRVQIEMTRELGQARLDLEQVNDPDAIDRGWSERVQEIRTRLLDGQTEDGRPRIDAKIKGRVGLAFDDLAVRHGLALGRVAVRARQTQRQANWLEYSREVVNQAAVVDGETRAAMIGQADEAIQRDLDAGAIDDLEAARRRLTVREEADGAAAISMISSDPKGFLDAVEAGQFAGIEASGLARLKVQAQGRLDRQAAADLKAAEVAARERQGEIGARLDELTGIFDAGRVAVDEAFLNDPEVKAHPKYARAMAALQLRNEQADLPFLPVSVLDERIAAEEKRPITRKWQAERLEVLRGFRDEAVKGWQSDPIDQAARSGFPVPDLPDPAQAAPDDLGRALVQRLMFGDHLKDQGYVERATYLSRAEVAALKTATDVSVDPARRAELASILDRTLGARDPSAMMAISDDPVFVQVGGLISAGGSPELAQEVFRGQQVMATKGIVMPKPKDRLGSTFSQLGTVFADLPGGAGIQAQVVAAADALYAARASIDDPTARMDDDKYRQALHEVMGGTGIFDSDEARGGVQDVDGRLVVLPAGMRAADAENVISDLHVMLQGGDPQSGRLKRLFQDTDSTRADLAVSLLQQAAGGARPFVAGKPIDAQTFSQVQLQAVGDDTYRLVFPAQSGNYYVEDENGKTFTFSLRDLVARVVR